MSMSAPSPVSPSRGRRFLERPLVRLGLTFLAFWAAMMAMAFIFLPDVGPQEPVPEARAQAAQDARRPDIDIDNPVVVQQDVDYSLGEAASWWPKGESPILSELVREGVLPPVEERVGPEPVVLEGPDGIGTYGGTWIEAITSAGRFNLIDQNYSYANLVRWSPTGLPIVPHIAKSWEVSEDSRVYTFYLRKGIRWSDGHPFTADDILYWYEYEVMDPLLGAGDGGVGEVIQHTSGIAKVEKLDTYTVRFTFQDPNGIFLAKLAGTAGRNAITPRHYLLPYHPTHGDPELIAEGMRIYRLPSPRSLYDRLKMPDNPACPRMWPWIYKTQKSNPPFSFVRNPYYYAVDTQGNQLPYIDRMHWEVKAAELLAASAASGELTVQTSELDFASYTLLAAEQDRRDYKLYHWLPSYRSRMLIMPNTNRRVDPNDPSSAFKSALLQEADFRKALSLAIDRKAIIQTAFAGFGEPAQLEPGPNSPFHYPSLASAYVEYDPQRASAYLDSLGLTQRDSEGFRTFPDGSRMEFYLLTKDILFAQALQLIVDNWADIGLRARVRVRSQNLWRTEIRSLAHDISVAEGWAEFFPLESPRHFVPTGSWSDAFYAYATWYKRGGMFNDPRALTGGAIEPPPGHPIRLAMQAYDETITLPTLEQQVARFQEILHIAEENLWTINIATPPPYLAIFRDDMRNVPEDAIAGSDMRTPGNLGFETFYFESPTIVPSVQEYLKQEIASPPTFVASLSEKNVEEGPTVLERVGTLIKYLIYISLAAGIILLATRHPFIGRRMLIMMPTLVVVSIVSFVIIQLPPGDFLTTLMIQLEQEGTEVSEQQIAEFREMFHLDDPPVLQYLRWVGVYWFFSFESEDRGLLQGYLGRSMETRRPVDELVGDRLALTIAVSLGTIIFTWSLAMPIGIYSAVRQYSPGDYVATLLGFLGMSIPNFLLAILLMYFSLEVFGYNVSGLFSPEFAAQPDWTWAKFVDLLKHIWVPILILGVGGTASMIRIMRANLLDELKKPYVTTARAKGVRPIKLIVKYPVRLALNPFISGIGHLFPQMVSGGAITAIILSLPTVGPLMLDAFRSEDMFVAGSMLVVLSLLGVAGTLVSDLLLLALDPRIRMQGGGR